MSRYTLKDDGYPFKKIMNCSIMKLQLIADWHGEQACVYYQKWSRTQDVNDERDYARHAIIVDKLWALLRKGKKV